MKKNWNNPTYKESFYEVMAAVDTYLHEAKTKYQKDAALGRLIETFDFYEKKYGQAMTKEN
jgi:hypothetical protein